MLKNVLKAHGLRSSVGDGKHVYAEGILQTCLCIQKIYKVLHIRILAKFVRGLEIDETALRAGFIPGVFATDAALRQVAAGVPWREAYHDVRDHLERLHSEDPDAAVAAKTHSGATAGLDYGLYERRLEELRVSVESRQDAFRAKCAALLSTPTP